MPKVLVSMDFISKIIIVEIIVSEAFISGVFVVGINTEFFDEAVNTKFNMETVLSKV